MYHGDLSRGFWIRHCICGSAVSSGLDLDSGAADSPDAQTGPQAQTIFSENNCIKNEKNSNRSRFPERKAGEILYI